MLATMLPLIGVLVLKSDLEEGWDGSPDAAPSLNVKAAEKVGLKAYYFSLQDVRLRSRRINGRTLDALDNWVTEWFAWPQVLYLQGDFPKNKRERRIWRALLRRTTRINQPTILPKWECHRALLPFADVKSYLPETRLLTTPSVALKMLDNHSSIYLKPNRGSEGRGIRRVSAEATNSFVIQSADSEAVTTFTRKNLRRYLSAMRKDTVVQAEVALVSLAEGRRVDTRILLQKDASDSWVVEYIGLRIGKPGSIITNVSRGGDWVLIEKSDEMIGWSSLTRTSLQRQLEEAALRVTRRLEQKFGRMGEIGLEFAFDGQGALWMLEANSQPSKYRRAADEDLPPKFLRLMEYAQLLYRKQKG